MVRKFNWGAISMTEFLSAVSAAAASAWARGSLFLSALAAVCIALTTARLACVYFQIEKAGALWAEYSLVLILSCVGLPILALFKWIAERKPPNLSLIPNEQQSLWTHSTLGLPTNEEEHRRYSIKGTAQRGWPLL
jgi:hypothetical protein